MTRTLVLGIYEDSGDTFSASVEATDPRSAMEQVALDIMQEPEGVKLVILGAIDSRLRLIPPLGNGGSGVHAFELAGGRNAFTA